MKFTADCNFGRDDATIIRNHNGAHLTFPNGWAISIQWGPGTYSSNHRNLHSIGTGALLDADTAEIAAWHDDQAMIEWPDGDMVQGWKTWDEVQALLELASRGALAKQIETPDPPKEIEA